MVITRHGCRWAQAQLQRWPSAERGTPTAVTIDGTPEHVQIMCRLDGARYMNEWIAPWLRGFRWSSPVRVGNSAAGQGQIDVFGELIDVLSLARRSGIDNGEHATLVERAIEQHVEEIWRDPGHGLCELRKASPIRLLEGHGVGRARSFRAQRRLCGEY